MSLKITEETTFLLDQVNPTYGDELATGWDTAPFWDTFQAGWSVATGVSISCDGTNEAQAIHDGMWDNTKTYKVDITATVNSGEITGPSNGTISVSYSPVSVTGSYSASYAPTPGGTSLYLISNNFNGTITALSIKEIL